MLLLLCCVPLSARDLGPGGVWKVGDRYRFEFSLSLTGFRPSLKAKPIGWTLDEVYVDTILEVDDGRPTRVSRTYERFELRAPGKKPITFAKHTFAAPPPLILLKKGRNWALKRPAPRYAGPIFKVTGSFSRWARLAEALNDTNKFEVDAAAIGDLFPRELVGRGSGWVRCKNPEVRKYSDGNVWTADLSMLANFKPSSKTNLAVAGFDGKLILDEQRRHVVSVKWKGFPVYETKVPMFGGDAAMKMKLTRLGAKK